MASRSRSRSRVKVRPRPRPRRTPRLPKPQTFLASLRRAGATRREIAEAVRAMGIARTRIARYVLGPRARKWRSIGTSARTPRDRGRFGRPIPPSQRVRVRFYDRATKRWISRARAMAIMRRGRYERTLAEFMRRRRISNRLKAQRLLARARAARGTLYIIRRYTSP